MTRQSYTPPGSALTPRRLAGHLPAPICAGRAAHTTGLSNLTGVTFQRVFKLYTSPTQVRFVFANIAAPGQGNATPESSAGPFTVSASVFWDFTGTTGNIVSITFGGVQSVTLNPWAVLVSDPVDVPFAQTAGTYFVVRSYVTQAGGLSYLALTGPPIATNGWNEGYNSGDLNATANSWNGATNDAVSGFGPVAVCGWDSTGKNRSTLLTGDSIISGTGWTPFQAHSFASWALDQAGVGSVNIGHSSETFGVATTYASIQHRLGLANGGCTNAICEYFMNDIYVSSLTLTQVKALALAYWSYLKARGMAVWQTTVLPECTSTDGFQTTASQAQAGTTGQQAIRQQINQWLRAPLSAGAGNSAVYDAGGNLAGVFDTGLLIEINADGSAITINPSTGAISNGSGGFVYVEATTYDTGTVTSIPNSQKLQDTTKSWTVNAWTGYSVAIVTDTTTPAAVGQVRQISANTSNTLTSDSTWTTTPSTAATYRIFKCFSLDGTHPTLLGHKRMAAAVDAARL